MRYWQSYRFVFNSPNWPTNLVLASVCALIPVIGQIVLFGYFFEIIDLLLLRRRGRAAEPGGEAIADALPADEDYSSGTYPDFSFNRFSEYLSRGVWPFLIRLISNVAIGMIGGVFLMVGMVLVGFLAAGANSTAVFLIGYGLVFTAYFSLVTVASILMAPVYLRAGLSGDFAAAFSMDFYRDFMKRVGKEVFLTEAFLMATGIVIYTLGLLMCYIGIFPAMALVTYAHHHLGYQLYELYLERGGVAVAPRVPPPDLLEEDRYREASSSRVRRPRPEERSTDIRRQDGSW